MKNQDYYKFVTENAQKDKDTLKQELTKHLGEIEFKKFEQLIDQFGKSESLKMNKTFLVIINREKPLIVTVKEDAEMLRHNFDCHAALEKWVATNYDYWEYDYWEIDQCEKHAI